MTTVTLNHSLEPRAKLSLSRRSGPLGEIAARLPAQGDWPEEDDLALETDRLIEFQDGCLKFLSMSGLASNVSACCRAGEPPRAAASDATP